MSLIEISRLETIIYKTAKNIELNPSEKKVVKDIISEKRV